MLKSDLTPEELVERIATKGGCTEVGVNFMNEQKTDELFYELIKQTAQKSKGTWIKLCKRVIKTELTFMSRF